VRREEGEKINCQEKLKGLNGPLMGKPS